MRTAIKWKYGPVIVHPDFPIVPSKKKPTARPQWDLKSRMNAVIRAVFKEAGLDPNLFWIASFSPRVTKERQRVYYHIRSKMGVSWLKMSKLLQFERSTLVHGSNRYAHSNGLPYLTVSRRGKIPKGRADVLFLPSPDDVVRHSGGEEEASRLYAA